MGHKWVDNEVYFGPDRRRAGPKRRWSERRHGDEAGELPPLHALLRRLRVQLMSVAQQAGRDRALQLTRAAIEQADRGRHTACSQKLREAGRLISTLDSKDMRGVQRADSIIIEAMSLMNND
ncbi:MAG: hypothetical protein ABUL55_01415 [Pseudomonadota bacterium]